MAGNAVTAKTALDNLISQQKNILLREYTRAINRDLAQQNPNQLLQRNLITVLTQKRAATYKILSDESLSTNSTEKMKSLLDSLFQSIVTHHRSSCALSNFPEEHQLSLAYINECYAAAEAVWLS